MRHESDGEDVISQLEQLKSQLDDSLLGLTEHPLHRPMHDVVGGLIRQLAAQHAEIRMLRRQLEESRRRPN